MFGFDALFQIMAERQTKALTHGFDLIEAALLIMAFRGRSRDQNVGTEAKMKPKSIISEKDVFQFVIAAAFELVKQRADRRVVKISRHARNAPRFPTEKNGFHLRKAMRAKQPGSLRKEKKRSRRNRLKAHLAKRCCSSEFP